MHRWRCNSVERHRKSSSQAAYTLDLPSRYSNSKSMLSNSFPWQSTLSHDDDSHQRIFPRDFAALTCWESAERSCADADVDGSHASGVTSVLMHRQLEVDYFCVGFPFVDVRYFSSETSPLSAASAGNYRFSARHCRRAMSQSMSFLSETKQDDVLS